MTTFEDLPVEVILYILHLTADFVGIESLLEISPRVRAVFKSNAVQITEDLLASFPATLYKLDRLFRIVALIHTPSFRCPTFDSYLVYTTTFTNLHDYYNARSDRSGLENSLYGTIRIGAKIQRLACACLSKMIDNLRLAGNKCWVNNASTRTTRLVLPRQENALLPPCWMEEFRVYRALWCLQLYSDLRYAATPIETLKLEIPVEEGEKQGWGRWSWSATDIGLINVYTPLGAIFHQKIGHEIKAVADLLIELGAAVSSQYPSSDQRYSLSFFTPLQVNNPATISSGPYRQCLKTH